MKNVLKKIVVFILEAEARAVLRKYTPKIIAITGSVGKTTTKDAVYTVLSEEFVVRKSEKSFNSEIGVPLTILGLPNAWADPFAWLKVFFDGLLLVLFRGEYPDWLVLEVGADRPGDIERVTRWLKPDIGVVTRLSKVPVHVEFFPSPEALRREKSFLAAAVKPTGTLILNADDEDVRGFSALAPTGSTQRFFGFAPEATTRASDYTITYADDASMGDDTAVARPTGVSYRADGVEVRLAGVLGMQPVYTTLAAMAVGVALGLSPQHIARALSSGARELTPGRMRLLAGVGGSTIIDDTYNSSPVAAHEALDTLAALRPVIGGRKIAVLGDMLELGEFSSREHRLAGEHAARVADMLITVGVRSRTTADGARSAGLSPEQVRSFDDSVAAGEFLARELGERDVVLCKGSQGVRMEKAVAMILADPSNAKSVLVRQDDEWRKR